MLNGTVRQKPKTLRHSAFAVGAFFKKTKRTVHSEIKSEYETESTVYRIAATYKPGQSFFVFSYA
jgi:hypothetical protein